MSTILRIGNQQFYLPDDIEDVAVLIPALSVARECREERSESGRPVLVIADKPAEIALRLMGRDTEIRQVPTVAG